jgi:hypothetical protein
MRLLSAEENSDKPGAVGDFYLEKILQNAEIANKLKACDINTLTPIEAMNFIFELKKLV